MHDVRHCPRCAGRTESLKAYRLPTFLLFLGIGASFQHGQVVGCPPCMRKELGRLALINILPANLLWLLLLAPWYTIAALRSLTKGHSDGAPSSPAQTARPGYRDAASRGEVPTAGPWNADPRVQPFLIPGRPGQLQIHVPYGGRVETLEVQLLAPDGPGYRARALQGLPQLQLAVGAELRLRHSQVHRPLVAVPDAVVDALDGLECTCARCGFEYPGELAGGALAPRFQTPCPACAGPMDAWRVPLLLTRSSERAWKIATAVLFGACVLFVGMAGYQSESLGVSASMGAAFIMGFMLFGWRAIPRLRAKRGHPLVVPAIATVGAFTLLALAAFFFFGIFPAL